MTDDNVDIRGLIKQVLCTYPGERLNQPDFGVGLQQYVFTPNTPESRAVIQNAVQAALNHWLADVIEVEEVEVTREVSSITVVVMYKVINTKELRQDVFFQEIL